MELTWGRLGVPVDVENRFEYKIEGLECLKSENVEKVLVFKRFLKGQGSHEYARESLQPSEPEYFGALPGSLLDTLGSLLHDLGYMRVTLESFWSNFKKHSFFQ